MREELNGFQTELFKRPGQVGYQTQPFGSSLNLPLCLVMDNIMSKRFLDTQLWEKKWFRKLEPEHKLFWIYILTRCDYAGIWEVDFELAEFFIGKKINIEKAREIFKEKYIEINNHKRWFIPNFIKFQYKALSDKCKPHIQVIARLKDLRLYEDYTKGIQTLKEKDKNKDKNKDKVKEQEKKFEEIWKKYPNSDGKKEAKRHFLASVKTDKDWEDIKKALANYLESKRVKDGYIKNGSTWFNNWRDWVDFKEPKRKDYGVI